jgi:hypothetical protein
MTSAASTNHPKGPTAMDIGTEHTTKILTPARVEPRKPSIPEPAKPARPAQPVKAPDESPVKTPSKK